MYRMRLSVSVEWGCYTLRGHNLRFCTSPAGCAARRRSRRSAAPLQAIGNEAARPPDAVQKRKLWPRKAEISIEVGLLTWRISASDLSMQYPLLFLKRLNR